jgi:hypothetical protein
MSLSPKDMDFVDAEHRFAMTRPSTPAPAEAGVAAREIALALGVPPSMRSIAPR